ncbi:hypothetical protein NKI39_13455 [Mesorhizobium sp. M0664]|uniref:hypothetical protein n=1 Tax=Mesorhizobium sp. M0664 TaxID=2956982 RepID=UPI00333CB48B
MTAQRFTLDVEATRAIRQAEVGAARTRIDRTADRFGLKPEYLAADSAYGSAANLRRDEFLLAATTVHPEPRRSQSAGEPTRSFGQLDQPTSAVWFERFVLNYLDNFGKLDFR